MRTWFITGVSSGFGRSLADYLLEKGERVVGSLRSEEQRVEFSGKVPGRSIGVLLDVTAEATVPQVIASVEAEVGPIDLLVNNAGYGFEGPLEEATMGDVRAQFEVNVFGAVSVMKAVLPYMRKRRSGHIINITSMGGIVTFPGLGVYHGSKFALEGISEALGKEVETFGIKVTAVAPGAFRTDWAGRSMQRGEATIADYTETLGPVRKARAERSGKQPGDPRKAAEAIYELSNSLTPPAHLLLGTDALNFVKTKLEDLAAEIDEWTPITTSTDFA